MSVRTFPHSDQNGLMVSQTSSLCGCIRRTSHFWGGGEENLCFFCFTSSWADVVSIVGVGHKHIWIINQIQCKHLRQFNMQVIYTVYHTVMFVFHSGLTTLLEAEVIVLATSSSLPTGQNSRLVSGLMLQLPLLHQSWKHPSSLNWRVDGYLDRSYQGYPSKPEFEPSCQDKLLAIAIFFPIYVQGWHLYQRCHVTFTLYAH